MKPRLLFISNLFPDVSETYRGLDNATAYLTDLFTRLPSETNQTSTGSPQKPGRNNAAKPKPSSSSQTRSLHRQPQLNGDMHDGYLYREVALGKDALLQDFPATNPRNIAPSQ